MKSPAAAVTYKGKDLLALPPEERAREGVFLAFQYPVEIPGVNNVYLLKAGLNAIRKHRGEPEVDAFEFLTLVREKMKLMQMDESFLNRGVNEGFSGGEKKRNEILQMAVLEPSLAVLDETDSGLDIDALRVVADGVNSLRSPDRAIVLVTHYQRLLDYIEPDYVHVLSGRQDHQERRQVARAGTRKARLRLGEAGGRGVSVVGAKSTASPVERYRAAFDARWQGDDELIALRRAALDQFLSAGFPTQRQEDWKYTNLRRLEVAHFRVGGGSVRARHQAARMVCHARPAHRAGQRSLDARAVVARRHSRRASRC